MAAYTTQYMEAYRSPHESPTGTGGVTCTVATLKMENNKLRDENEKINTKNKEMAEELIRLRQQLSYIRVAARPKRRPPALDLSSVPEYHTSESRIGLSRAPSCPVLPLGRSISVSSSLSESSKVE